MFFFLFIFLSFSACTEKERTYTTDMLDIEKEIPFIFRSGGKYSLKTAEITNLITKEVAIKTVDDILFSEDKEWYCLYSFSTSIHKESKFFYIDDIWYYSIDRVKFISENESNISWEYQSYIDAVNSGKTKKKWITMQDTRVRHTHKKVNGKTIGINDVFLVGDSLMLHSGDSSLGAEAKELISCRCTTKYF